MATPRLVPPQRRQAGRSRTAVVPDLAAGAGVERVTLVGGGNVHDAAHHDRRHLQARRVGQGEHPLRPQARDVRLGDLGQRGVAVAARVAVVAGPIGARGDFAKLVARAAQQVDALVVGPQLQIVEALVEHLALQGLAVGGLDFLAHRFAAEIARLQGAQEARERLHFGIGDLDRRHARPAVPVRISVANCSLLSAGRRRRIAGPMFAAIAVRAVASRAAAFKYDAPGVGVLRRQGRRQKQCGEEKGGDAHKEDLRQYYRKWSVFLAISP